MCQSSPVQLLPFLLPSSFSQLLATKEATLFEDEHHSQHTGQQEPKHIQRVVLDPAEVMGCHTKMLGSFVTHDKTQSRRLLGPGASLADHGEFLITAWHSPYRKGH